jgi:conjugative transfer signal peptidase TraF
MTRSGILLTTSAATVGIALTAFIDVPKKLIWNSTASVPLGLYAITTADHLAIGNRVAIDPPEPLATFLAERGYLPRGVPLLKTIAAIQRQRVCRIGSKIIIDGKAVGETRARDRLGRELPVWQGCRCISEGEFFLMNASVPDSFDGRYFGPTPATAIIGKAVPLWTDAQGETRLQQPAANHPSISTNPTKEHKP